jgi:hypothetical protein
VYVAGCIVKFAGKVWGDAVTEDGWGKVSAWLLEGGGEYVIGVAKKGLGVKV